MTSEYHQTIVIGAGISGIKASIDLTRNGIDTLILEARERVGGRLYTIKSDSGIPMDIGASWFHDCLDNPLLHKAYDQGHIKFYYDDGRFDIYTKEHGLVDENHHLQAAADEIKDYLKQICMEKYTPETDVSLREACLDYLKLKGYTLTDELIRYAPQLIRYYEMWIGSSWNALSARQVGTDEHFGRNAMVTNGYITFYNDELDELASVSGFSKGTDLIGSKIRLNQVVYKIRFDDQSKQIFVHTRNELTRLETVYRCEYLICSTPLSILKLQDTSAKGAIEWQPPLPSDIRAKLGKVSFSGLGKVFLEFKNCFWSKETDRFLYLPEPDDELTEAYKTGKSITFEKEDKEIELTSSPDPFKYVVLFMNLYRAAGVPILLALISQPLTGFIEASSDEVIWKFFKPLVRQITGKRWTSNPVSIHHTNWTHDPFSRGAYTGVSVGDDVEACINALKEAKGIFDDKGRVRFVGEGIIEQGNGCVHGAWLTGKREAEKVVKLVNRGKL
ncbi:DEKNAAC105290 [Brettanomyces naardenensis]|uniref:DEKNAAC105290 n=1 Tax=Brettanomyces naardenensis TaxID=13370 RepID=A0A448YT24_BRENA|nr:DEKNAAC105290 [Brettanomyces naardenensis]